MTSSKFDSDSLQSQITLLQNENEKAKAEVKEVLQALEELAMNYDQKLQEVDNKNKENDKLLEDLSSKQVGYFHSVISFVAVLEYICKRLHHVCKIRGFHATKYTL